MNLVKIKTSDGKIWNPEQTISDLIQASFNGPVLIDLLAEGPCCQTSGIDAMLDQIIKQFNFNPSFYTISTSNQVPSSAFKEQRTSFVELEYAQQKAKSISDHQSSLKKRFGMFISRSNWIRLSLASYINDRYSDQTIMTYHYDPKSDYHVTNFGLEELLNKSWNDIDTVINFLEKLPMRPKKLTYPILWNEQGLELDDFYKDIFCDVVCETYFSGKTFFMTEKTMRPIIHKRPFLVQGPQWYLKNLKKLGFKTFDQWWDEGYDEDPWDFKHIALRQNIDYIAQQNEHTIQCWYNEMSPTLEHNYNVFMSLTSEKILETKFYA